jgi:ribosome maturation factor RimP
MTSTPTSSGDPRALVVDFLTGPLNGAHLELVDVEVESLGTSQAVVRVLVEHASSHVRGPRIDLDGVAEATRIVDAILEANDPISTAFTLEVSSPGLERPLRTPEHFARFVGTEITVKTRAGTPGERRVHGILEAAAPDAVDGDAGIVVSGRSIAYATIERAKTVFRWGEETPTVSGPSQAPRKKGALPKGARPIHPKLLAQAESKREVGNDALASSSHVVTCDQPADDTTAAPTTVH